MVRFRDVLFKNKNFTLLWFSQLISNFGDRLSQMALIALVWHKAPGSALQLAKLMSFTIIPVFLIGPVAGAWVDRLNRRDVMVISDLLRGVLALALAFFVMTNKMMFVYIVIFLIFSLTRFFLTGRMAIIPELVAKEELLIANTLSDTTKMLGNAVGLVVAGLIVNMPSIGAMGGFLIYAATFFISAALVGMIVRKEFFSHIKEDIVVATHALEASIKKSIFGEMKDGLKLLFKYSDMRFVMVMMSLLMAGLGAVYCVAITYIQGIFGNATRDLSFLALYLMVGLFTGTVIYGKLGQRIPKRNIILLSLGATGGAVLSFTVIVKLYASLAAAGVSAFCVGFFASPITISMNTLVHEIMPNEARGKTFSSLEAIMHVAFLICMLLTGILDRYVGKAWILAANGAFFLLLGALGLVGEARREKVTS